MFRLWKFLFLAFLSITVLSACGKTFDEQASEASQRRKKPFNCMTNM